MTDMIFKFNNEGVSFIERGCYSQAIIMFQGALQVFKQITKKNHGNDSDEYYGESSNILMQDDDGDIGDNFCNHHHHQEACSTSSMRMTSIGSFDPQHPYIQRAQDQMIDREKADDSNNNDTNDDPSNTNIGSRLRSPSLTMSMSMSIAMYTDPIKITLDQIMTENTTTSVVHTPSINTPHVSDRVACRCNTKYDGLACIVIFNRALATHLQALDLAPSTEQETRFLLATSLYELAQDIIPDDLDSMDMRCTAMLTLATLNNICLIYHDLGKFDEALPYYYDLETSVQWLRGYADTMGLAELWSGVHMNTIVLGTSKCASSA